MPDLKSNSIPLPNKVLSSAQINYAHKDFSERALPNPQGKALSLTVVSVNDSSVVLKPENGNQRLHIDKAAIVGLSSQQNVQSGDKLILISHSANTATFYLKSASANVLTQSSAPLIQALAQQWPDIPISSLKKALPEILSQVSLNASSPVSQKLASNIIEIANKLGKPLLNISVNARVTSITQHNFAVQISHQHSGQSTKLSLPASAEILNTLKLDDKLNISFNGNMQKGAIQKIDINNQSSFSNAALKTINQYLHERPNTLKPLMSTVLIDEQSNKPKAPLILDANHATTSKLGTNIQEKLVANIPPRMLEEAKIVFTSANSQASTQQKQAAQNIQLMLMAKPVLVKIPSNLLMDVPEFAQNNKQNKLSNSSIGSSSSEPTAKQVATNMSPATDMLKRQLLNSLVQSQTDMSQHDTKPPADNTLATIQKNIAQHLQQSHAYSGGLSKTLNHLLSKLQDIATSGSTELKDLVNKVLLNSSANNELSAKSQSATNTNATRQLLPTQYSVDDLQQIFSVPAMPRIMLTNTESAQNQAGTLVSGLVTMLQASLMAKLTAQQPQLANQLASLLPIFNKNAALKQAPVTVKTLQELHRNDPKSELINQLNKVLGNHSTHKLAAAENTLQGQDSFYYALPNAFSPEHKDIELLIQREQQNTKDNKSDLNATQWRLSMKLDIGKKGEVLAKVKLMHESIDLHLYASNEALKAKIDTMLPMLQKRLAQLGLKVNQQSFVGKIPDSLHKTNYQVVQAYV